MTSRTVESRARAVAAAFPIPSLARRPRERSLFRFLALASAAVMLGAMVLAGYTYHRNAIADLVELAEKHNVSLAKVLSNLVWSRYGSFIESVGGATTEDLFNRRETVEIDAMLRLAIEGLPILKAKIYNVEGLTIYSTDFTQTGEVRSADSAFFKAVTHGVSQSKLSSEDQITAFSGELFNREVVESYVPVFDADDAIVGVFELYTDVTDLRGQIDHTAVTMVAVLSIVFVAVYSILIFAVLRRAMAPIRKASEQASAIDPRASRVRLSTEDMPVEILPLIRAVNDALDRLDAALDGQRRFAADAAHELLTPLAVLAANLDTLRDKEAAASIRGDVDTMSEIVAQLLALAELDALSAHDIEPADLAAAGRQVVSMLAPLACKEGKEVAFVGPDAPVRVMCPDEPLVGAIRNLVDNAIAHAPPGTAVVVEVRADGTIRVADRGPGIPRAERELVFQRFWRGDRRSRKGAGLGLSIVKRVVDACGGDIEIGEGAKGGALISLRLPLAPGAGPSSPPGGQSPV